jgi:hypothetical protein
MMTKQERKTLWVCNLMWLALLLWLAVGWTDSGYRDTVTVCPTKLVWRMPCPTCGVTRAFLLTAHGRFAEALQMNINVLLLIPAYIIFPLAGIIGLATGKNLQLRLLNTVDKMCRKWAFVVPFAIFEITAEALNLYHHFTIGMP